MSKGGQHEPASIGDLLALKLQQLHKERKLEGDQPLLRIDYREEAAQAPFQFDAARSKLHRTGCRAIPQSSRTALFGVWRIQPEDQKHACRRCCPGPESERTMDKNFTSDLFYGLLSIVDQFGNVLRERGREYRNSESGQQAELDIEGLYARLGKKEKETLDVVLSSLDDVLKMVRDFNRSLNGSNGRNGGGSQDASE